jgi:biotin carboxylase
MRSAEVPQPDYARVSPGSDGRDAVAVVGYPLVVKPLDRSAGQGVIRVDGEQDLGPALRRVRSIVGATAPLLVEEYMKGDEVALEGIVRDGELTTLTIFDKPDAGEGPHFPETILITPTRLDDQTQTECRRVAGAALAAIGITHGPVHVELMVDGGTVKVIEVAARSIGGLCSRSLNFGLLGTTLEGLILRNALGMEKPELRREPNASGVLMIPIPRAGRLIAVEGLDEVRTLEHISAIDITAPIGSRLQPPPEGDRYLGFVFARGGERDRVEAALRQAMEMVEVVVG